MPRLVSDGPYAGWMFWKDGHDGRFSDTALGPFWFREEDHGLVRCRVETGRQHTNGAGFIHGGMMMAFADMAYFAIAWRSLEKVIAVTLTANFEFMGAAKPGEPVDAVGRVMKETGKLIFVQAQMEQNGQILATTSATLRKISRAVIIEKGMRTEG